MIPIPKQCVLILLLLCLTGMDILGAEIWVSPKGSNLNPGTRDKPLADISFALRKARELRRTGDSSVTKGISIILREGLYQLQEPIVLRPEDAGTATSPTIISAAPGERPVISGGRIVSGWKISSTSIAGLPAAAKGKVWVAEAPYAGDQIIDFRQLYINDQKALRAKDTGAGKMNRILSWNHQDQTCWIPRAGATDLSKVKGLEMLIHQWWAIAILRVKSVTLSGDSARLSFYQPESRIQSEHPWPAPWISKQTGNSAFFLSNAIQFLNEPGEWFLDKVNRKIYYWPKKNENLSTASVTIPVLENLLIMKGTADRPVSYVYFKGISFAHSSWLRPSQAGHVPHQSGMYMMDAYKLKIPGTADKKTLENQAWVGRPPAAAEVAYAHHTGFTDCSFKHLGATGLDYQRGTHDNQIMGNLFKDISGTGIQTGVFSDEAQEVHIPYQPKDEREICSNDLFSNNVLTDIANEDWGAVGIGAGYVRGIRIEHNDLSELSYMGISMGWGWTRTVNVMKDNRISRNRIVRYGKHMYDVSAIYTLSAQPNSFITGNVADSIYKAPYAHDPNHWFYLYTDEGSSFITVKDNWTRSDKYLQNANGPGNIWQNNGPRVADSISASAGLETAYRPLLREKSPADSKWKINHSEKMKVIEIIGKNGQQLDMNTLTAIRRKYGLPASSVYQWNNHIVIYGAVEDPFLLRDELQQTFIADQIKIYNSPFYEFNRSKQCPDEVSTADWDHYIFTADLVKDTVLQREYLRYHQNQLKEWPEVSKGFCNAGFQQLQVFKNGDQLMLVISISKGANLDELNPRTTANNPRVEEWNQLMKKYQQGISGTKTGEVWVPFKQIN
ncbi:L-rhamnose mutarotase [Pedobacter sp. MC2016-15]|uniref:L-rhamnose mutarotase n=1 Tax=Pedobacter sp. MC2016-15 TaxID=2994473 RepID=UPI00224706C7|nr:L-rhamnose mutarotase [Pedobacter sp. MC2016-15]